MVNKKGNVVIAHNTLIGRFVFKLHVQETEILRVLLAPDGQVFEHWKKLCATIGDYESASSACKELMPAAVRKVQLCVPEGLWQSVANDNLNFLAGLPRYAWTKNQLTVNQSKSICNQLIKNGIDVIAIKGIAEILSNPGLGYMRTCRDMDLLVKPKDLNECRRVLKTMGWQEKNLPAKSNIENFIKNNAYNFYKEGFPVELDLHIALVPYLHFYSEKFTDSIWRNKVATTDGFSIPGKQDRLLIATANAFDMGNWKSGMHGKYFFDAISLLSTMDAASLQQGVEAAEALLSIGEKMEQMIAVALKILPEPTPPINNFLRLRSLSSKRSRKLFSFNLEKEAVDYFIKWNLVIKAMERRNSLPGKLKVIQLITQRFLNLLRLKV